MIIKQKKQLSILLAFVLVCQMVTIPTSASELFDDARMQVTELICESELNAETDISKEVNTELKYTQELDLATVPQAIDEEKAKEAKHVKRLYQEEKSLNTAVFENEDGSKTLYSFGHPIKYKDKGGNIKDISLNLKSNGKGDYVSEESDIITTFPETLSEGINLSKEDEDINVTMYILDKGGSKSKSKVKGGTSKATYEYDANTDIEYSLTYNGMKEDIIVDKYTGISEYSFMLLTDGLKLIEKAGCLTLVDKNDIDKVCVGDAIIYTANHKKTEYGTMTFETIKEREEYIVTIHIDEDFLKASDTAYPIIIDPSIEINRTGSGATAIEDVTINSAGGSNGSATSLYVGRRDSVGISRIMMKFPGLTFGSIGASDRITSAYLNIRDITQTTDIVTVKCYTFAGNEWSGSTANWSNIDPNSISTHLDDKNIHYGYGAAHDHTYIFNITKAVKGWMVGNMNKNKGVVLKLDNSEESGTAEIVRAFGSYNRSSGQPYLVVNYSTTGELPFADNTFYYNNWYAGKYLGYNIAASLLSDRLAMLGNTVKWEIRKVDDGYVIRSKVDSSKYLAAAVDTSSSIVEIVAIEDMSILKRCKWTITKIRDGYCLIKNVYNGKYLYVDNDGLRLSEFLGTEGTVYYRRRVWRYAGEGYYGISSSSTKMELNNNFKIDICMINAGESIIPTINKSPDNALWAEPTDFKYVGYDDTKIFYNEVTGRFTSILTSTDTYSTQITATHKITGISKTFSFVVNPKAILLAVKPNDNRDRISWLSGTSSYIENMGINNVVENYGSYTSEEVKNMLCDDSNCIFVSRSHGLYVTDEGVNVDTGISTNEFATGADKGYLCGDDINNLPNDALSNIKLAVFVGCNTAGPGPTDKLPRAVVIKGATTAIGFEDTIYTNEANDWVEDFFGKLAQGTNAYDACDELRVEAKYRLNGLDKYVIYGNSELSFR